MVYYLYMVSCKENKCVPMVKWVGGKRQLIDKLLEKVPKDFDTYYEPFFGGGALFFALQPEKAVINDYNVHLMNMCGQIAHNLDDVIKTLNLLENEYNNLNSEEEKKNFYYERRNEFNKLIVSNDLSVRNAALLIFLNKCGFNGLYRMNSKNEFNTPWGHKNKIHLFDSENIKNVSNVLKQANMSALDFENVCNDVKGNDFVFFDSPYYATFDTYQANGFKNEDHVRLANLFKRLTEKGVKCMLTNSNTDFIKDLYKDYNIEVVNVKRLVNADASNRVGQEIIVTNY